MNFLAHLYLSGNDEDLIIGNFIGDTVKGSKFTDIDKRLIKGVLLHRLIDYYTDNHEIVKKSTQRLHENFHKYSGVIVDVYYDHLLAVHWNQFSDESLRTYTNKIYSLIENKFDLLTPRAQYIYPFMKKNDWLFNYQYTEGIKRTFFGLSKRAKFDSGMEYAIDYLEKDYVHFQEEFFAFFQDLNEFVLKSIENNLIK